MIKNCENCKHKPTWIINRDMHMRDTGEMIGTCGFSFGTTPFWFDESYIDDNRMIWRHKQPEDCPAWEMSQNTGADEEK